MPGLRDRVADSDFEVLQTIEGASELEFVSTCGHLSDGEDFLTLFSQE